MCLQEVSDDVFLGLLENNSILEISKMFGVSKTTISRKIRELKQNGLLKINKKCIKRSFLDYLIGERFGHLVVKEITKEKTKTGFFIKCLCDCGNETVCYKQVLSNGNKKTCASKTCPFHRQEYSNNGKKNIKFTGYEEISGCKWAGIKAGARRRNLEFNITLEYAWDLFILQEKKCALTKLDIFFGTTNTKLSTASLDRIDSSKGYIENNIQWLHKDINVMKWDFDSEYFKNLCKLVVDNSLKN